MFRTLAFDQPIQEQTRESFTAMIGFKKIYSNPLHFFLRVKDIRDENKRKIKYFAYTTNAAPKQIFWGYFDRENETFSIHTRCSYNAKDYAKFYYEWKDSGYMLVDTYVEDRISKTMYKYLNGFPSENDYIFYKTWFAVAKGNVSNITAMRHLGYDVQKRFENWVELRMENEGFSFGRAEKELIKHMRDQIKLYESVDNIRQSALAEGEYISDLFYHFLEKNPDIADAIPDCPRFDQCKSDPASSTLCSVYIPSHYWLEDVEDRDEPSLS